MSALATEPMHVATAARIMREAVKDKRYRGTPVGQEVGRFLRAKRLEGCRPLTIVSYESVLQKLALDFADIDSLEPFVEREHGPERLAWFMDTRWGDADQATREHHDAVLRSFFEWAYRVDRISGDPMRKIARPRRRREGATRPRVPAALVQRLGAQPLLRDRAAILTVARLGLRREDLRLLQLADIDLTTDELRLRHVKGGGEAVLPIVFRDLHEAIYLHLQERGGHPDEFLLYPKTNRTRSFSPAGIAQWFDRCCARAGVVGYSLHQLRHAAIDEVRRQTGDLDAARQLARHSHASTTQTYLHATLDELRDRLRGMT